MFEDAERYSSWSVEYADEGRDSSCGTGVRVDTELKGFHSCSPFDFDDLEELLEFEMIVEFVEGVAGDRIVGA